MIERPREDFESSRATSGSAEAGASDRDHRLKLLETLALRSAEEMRLPRQLLIDPLQSETSESYSGTTLDHCIDRARTSPSQNWKVILSGGLRTLVGQFANFARLLAVLNDEGVPLQALPPEAVVLGSDGQLRLRIDRIALDVVDRLDELACRIAPEILLSKEPIAARECQIVYALAVLIHECAVGRPPWSGRSATEVADRLLSRSHGPSAGESISELPGLLGLLEDALSLDSEDRPASLRGFASMLDAARDGARPRARRNSTGEVGTPRRRWVPVVGGIGLVLIAGWLGRSTAAGPATEDLIRDLSSAMLARPLPVHAEDAPVHSLGQTLLDLHGERAMTLRQDAAVQRQLAWVALRAGDPRAARIAARYAIQVDSTRPGPWIVLGIAAIEQGDQAGLLEIDVGMDLEPTDRFDLWSRAAAQMYLFRFDSAADTFEKITLMDPSDADAWFHHSLASLRSGDVLSASASLARSRRIRPFDGWIDWLSAEIAHSEGRDGEAHRVLEEATTRFSSSAALALRIGSLWDRLGDTSRGKEWIRRADSQRLTSPLREWREAGRFVEEGRAHLLLGPPSPPESMKTDE